MSQIAMRYIRTYLLFSNSLKNKVHSKILTLSAALVCSYNVDFTQAQRTNKNKGSYKKKFVHERLYYDA